jgi:hypothetical protein
MKLKRMKAINRKTIGQNKYCQHNCLFVAEAKILHKASLTLISKGKILKWRMFDFSTAGQRCSQRASL